VTFLGATAPTADVVNTGAQVSVVPALVTVTPANWQMAQVVTVSAIDDALVEGPHSVMITHTSSSI